MKKNSNVLIILLLLGTFFINAQDATWDKMMEDPNANFKEIQQKFENHFRFEENKKGNGYKQFKRWEYFMYRRTFPSGEMPNPASTWRENQKYLSQYAAKKNNYTKQVTSNWIELGPRTAADITGHWAPGLGRINSIAVHPTDSRIIYVGTPSGGLWKTTTEGNDWIPLTDNLPVIGISSVVINPSNPSIMYMATGDADGGYTYSIGVLKSVDAGQTWNETGLSSTVLERKQISKVIINPSNPSILFAAATDGLYKTTDAGVSWRKVSNEYFRDIELRPSNPNTVYGFSNRFYRSTDGGENFTAITSIPEARRGVIAVTPANNGYVYVITTQRNGNSMGGVYRSTNSGGSFSKVNSSSTPDMFGYQPNDGLSQAWYDLAITVSDIDANEVHLGAIVTWKSSNGGVDWERTSEWIYGNSTNYIHPDIHDMQYINGKLYIGNDGLLVTSTDEGSTFNNISEGLGNRQFYRLGLSKTNPEVLGGGTQDNGSSIFSKGRWHEWLGADGGNLIFNWKDENIVYGIIQQGQSWHKSVNGGEIGGDVSITSPGGGAWVVPYEMDHNDPDVLVAGCSEVVKTTDGMQTWSTISDLKLGILDAIALAPSNSNYIYTSKDNTIYVTKDGGANWVNISNGLPNRFISYISVHPSNPEKVAISFSGYADGEKVYTSDNGGTTWQNISGTLPNIPANCVLYHDISENGLYIGMDVGVYYIDDTETDWQPFITGIPNVIISELEIHEETNKITAATFGRGMWRSDVAVNKKIVVDFYSDDLSVKPNEGSQLKDNSKSLTGATITSWQWSFPGGIPDQYTGQFPPKVFYENVGSYDVTLTITDSNGNTRTKTKSDYINIQEDIIAGGITVVEACSGLFYDSGTVGNYKDNDTNTTTISPKYRNSRVKVDFKDFKMEYAQDCEYDYLEIYDGKNTAAPLIGRFCSYNSPGTIIANNADGSLTFKFVSDEEFPTSGWKAEVSCIPIN
ncbi:CUB domain-containing protein [Aquimarina sp. 2201CG5-10]|uniref:CUB domain-containing protein n=1 Tax=Aquimarina callyspongiae TaxID=3098150 RepID=UPI002AB3F219|nr:CUB domain-containing protein [Aquimarina sp. 2201CG5-10]MDY8134848.1 CUB domain-containing protein [Aquimarina sp. 2201CG5-10]